MNNIYLKPAVCLTLKYWFLIWKEMRLQLQPDSRQFLDEYLFETVGGENVFFLYPCKFLAGASVKNKQKTD